jgi:hypothetical protein
VSKFLEMIGLHALTNREALMEELDALNNDTFERMILSRESDLPEVLEQIKCDDCKKQHGGKCPAPDDDTPCVITLSEWMSQPCEHESLISEVKA